MPGMTMVFTVRDKGQLTSSPGDKVQFTVVQEGGKMVVTDIQPAR
jgi:Cu/Ag efflux protein CusF